MKKLRLFEVPVHFENDFFWVLLESLQTCPLRNVWKSEKVEPAKFAEQIPELDKQQLRILESKL